MSLNIIPKPAADRVLKDSSDYCNDIKNDQDKIPYDENGNLVSGGFNFSFHDREKQCREMDALLSQNKNQKAKPLQHLVFAYENERPTHKKIRRHVQRYLENVGMIDHMCLYDAHANTGHFHVHVLLCRLNHEPDADGTYKIADKGLFKTPNEKGTLRTNEAVCRQATIAQICREEGWEPPPGLKYDDHGKPIPRKTKAKGKGFNGIPSKSDQLAALAWDIFCTSTEKMEPAERLAALGVKIQLVQKQGTIVGAKLISGTTSCSFSNMCPNEKGLYKKLSQKFALAPGDTHPAPAYASPFHAENHLRELMRPVFMEPACFGTSWDYLIGAIQAHEAQLERSGGGLIVVRGNAKVTTSSISNKCSLSKLEKLLGPCPILKAAPPTPTPRDLLIRDAAGIFKKHVDQGHDLYWIKPDLDNAGIHITQKSFPNTVGKRQFYYAVERDNVSVPISSISKNKDNRSTHSMYLFERLSKNDPSRSIDIMMEERKRKFEEINRRCRPGGDLYEKYMVEALRCKTERVEKLSFFAAIAQFINIKKQEKENVYSNSSSITEERSSVGSPSLGQSMFAM